ncbi:MAG: hypothetical protein ACRDI3_07170 [Actinomycetota bacterium]
MRARHSLIKAGSPLFGVILVAALVLPSAPALAGPRDGRVEIETDRQFDAAHGVRSGSGTKADPYVIEGWDLHHLEIHDTSRCVLIRNNVVGTLILNWIDRCTTVVRNRVSNLLVNQNVKRTGEATSGLIAHNEFDVVGQLRHWDGVFSRNVVGSPPEDDGFEFPLFGGNHNRAANLDGFNGAVYKHNTFYGYVETRLHGHHHSSGFGEQSHYHGTKRHTGGLDHMNRYHRVNFTRNTIHSGGPYGLIYTDSAHSANDRTAASEQNPELDNPHVHYTRVALTNNRLIGSGIVLDIFNADDERHLRTETGHFTIARNKIVVREYREDSDAWSEPPVGIEVREAKDLHLHIFDNLVTGEVEDEENDMGPLSDTLWKQVTSGINLWSVEKAWIHIMNNTVTNRDVGILARDFKNVTWWISGFDTKGVPQRIDYDNSSSRPRQSP